MNWIEKMIAEQCPNGVKKVKLGEISNIITGGELKKGIVVSSEKQGDMIYPVFGNGRDVYGYINSYRVKNDSVCISSIGANTGTVFFHKGKFTPIIRLKVIELIDDNIDAKYVYYIISIMKISSKNGGGIPNINANDVKKIEIPLPPPSIQKEIVSVLDKFSELIEKTDEEIALRQKQYEYYREKLLTFENGEVEWKTLPNFSTNQDKKRKPITGSERIKGNYPYYGASGIVDYVEGYIFDGDYLLISEDGANLVMRSTPIAFGITGKNWVNNHAHVIEFDNRCTQRIVELYLNSIDLTPWISGGAQPKLNQENLNKIPIPIPSLSRQQEIVDTLDKFEALISKLKEERELRQKQYEYYREKLLTF